MQHDGVVSESCQSGRNVSREKETGEVKTMLVKVKDIVIYKDENYNTFPSVAVLKNSEIVVAFRQAPDRQQTTGVNHFDTEARLVCVHSKDGGNTWNKTPTRIYKDDATSTQDPYINFLRDGTLFCSFFRVGISPYCIRSADGGKTWDTAMPITEAGNTAVRGHSMELDDGSILVPVYAGGTASAVISKNKGKTWSYLADIASDIGYDMTETSLYKTKSGKLMAFIRAHCKGENVYSKPEYAPLFTCESSDNGKTWSDPVKRDFYSPSPYDVIRLKSGNVLMTYGYRYQPYGIHAALLNSECSNLNTARGCSSGGRRRLGYWLYQFGTATKWRYSHRLLLF